MRQLYYLETNALIALSVQELSCLGNPYVYTSSLALLEFYKGLSEENYERRKAKLKIISTVIEIDWIMPLRRFHKIVDRGTHNQESENSNIIREYAEKLINSNSYEDFIGSDNDMGSLYKKMSVELVGLGTPVSQMISGGYTNFQRMDYFECEGFGLFLKCCRFYNHNYLNKTPDRNDLVDLIHALYVKDRDTVIVTNDKKLSKICRRGARLKVISIEAFREHIIMQ